MEGIIRLDDYFYDSERLAAIHPGGALAVLTADGRDGTALFHTSHRRPFPHERYTEYRVTDLEAFAAARTKAGRPTEVNPPPKVTASQDWANFFELCDRIKAYGLAPTAGFATWHYFVKVAVLLLAAAGLDIYFLWSGQRTWGLSLLCGLVHGWIGLNIQHDANHGAVSRNAMVNRILGLTQDFIGGSSIGWNINHNVIHHTVCNDVVLDGDLNIPLMRLKKSTSWAPQHQLQQLYIWLLEAGFGPLHIIQYIFFNWLCPESKRHALKSFFWLNRSMSIFLFIRVVGGLIRQPGWETVGMILAQCSLGGFYLAFFFLLSHNFVGVRKEGVDATRDCFVRNQAETSSDVGGWVLQCMNGGLNYQIEHHLFPRIHHSHYYYIAPLVKQFCKEKGIAYCHFPTILDNAVSTYRHLAEYGRQDAKPKKE